MADYTDRLRGSTHLPDNIRLWQGDSIGHWEGDTLVVDTTNLNGKTWLNEVGEIVSYAEHVVERLRRPQTASAMRPRLPIRWCTRGRGRSRFREPQKGEMIEVACHEEDRDLVHLKAVRDAARGKK